MVISNLLEATNWSFGSLTDPALPKRLACVNKELTFGRLKSCSNLIQQQALSLTFHLGQTVNFICSEAPVPLFYPTQFKFHHIAPFKTEQKSPPGVAKLLMGLHKFNHFFLFSVCPVRHLGRIPKFWPTFLPHFMRIIRLSPTILILAHRLALSDVIRDSNNANPSQYSSGAATITSFGHG